MRPQTFFFYSWDCDGLPLAYRLARDGHRVLFYTEQRRDRFAGRGLVETVSSPDPPRGATVIFDSTGFAEQGAAFRRRGHPVIGGNRLEAIEDERVIGTRLMLDRGINAPPTHSFKTLAQARAFLKQAPESTVFFFKPDDAPKTHTRGAKPAVLLRFLDYIEPSLKPTTFQLQEQVDGTEISCCVWFNGRDVVAAEPTIEEKKFGTGNTGSATGCQSNIVWDIGVDAPLVLATIGNFVDDLAATHYVGMLDLNSIIAPDGRVYGLEFTARLGYDCTQARSMLWDDTYGEQLAAFAAGELSQWERDTTSLTMTLRLSTLPQPLDVSDEKPDFADKYRFIPLPQSLLDDPHFFPDDWMVRRGSPCIATGSGHLGVLGTIGNFLAPMRKNLVDRADALRDSLEIPDLYYRTDPVSRAEKDLAALESLGLLRASSFIEKPAQLDEAVQAARRLSDHDLEVLFGQSPHRTRRPAVDDDDHGAGIPDSIAGTDGDLVEGGMTGGPSNDAAPAPSDGGNVANP